MKKNLLLIIVLFSIIGLKAQDFYTNRLYADSLSAVNPPGNDTIVAESYMKFLKGHTGDNDTSLWKLNGLRVIYNQGNVGIGTTNPGYMLQVADNIGCDTLFGRHDWDSVYNTPETLSGYGIIDAYTKTETQNLIYDTANILRAEWRVDIHDSLVANSQGYITTETDPIFTAHMVSGITATDTSNWNSAFGWGNHATMDYQNDADTNSWDATRYWVTQNYLGSFTETDPIFTAHVASGITGTNITNWQTAYGWGDHGAVGYIENETDPIYSADPASLITNTNLSNWNSAFGWGNHATMDYQNDADTNSWDATRYWVTQNYLGSFTETDPIFTAHVASGITGTNITNWQTAYGWGDHGAVGYIENETDPIYSADPASLITNTNLSNWNSAFGWGNHATMDYQNDADTNSWDATRYWVTQNYLGSFTETDPIFTAHVASGITGTNITNWQTAYGWGDHGAVGYIENETDPIYSADPASLITNTNLSNWNSAFGWGNHATMDYQNDADTNSWDATRYWVGQQGYLTSISETDPIYSADPASSITNTNITNWQTAYGWGNHATMDYQNDADTNSWDATRYWVTQNYLGSFTETDPIYSADPASSITNTNITNWQTAYGWGNHGDVDYQNDSDTTSWDATRYWVGQQGYLTSISETDPIYSADPASLITNTNLSNWNSAFGWGNHATMDYQNDADTNSWDATRYWVTQNYLGSFTETDPIFTAHVASGITGTNITNWQTAYGWGDHGAVGYIENETDPIYSADPASLITNTNLSNWNSAFGWGNHATMDYQNDADTNSWDATKYFVSTQGFGNVSVTGTPVDNQVSIWNNGTTIEGSNDFVFTGSYVGIGTTSPIATLHVLHSYGLSSVFERANNVAASNPIFILRRTRGTVASPDTVQTGDNLGQIAFEGYITGSTYNRGAAIFTYVDGINAAGTYLGVNMVFSTRDTLGVMSRALHLMSNNNIGIGTSDPVYLLQVADNIGCDTIFGKHDWDSVYNSPVFLQWPDTLNNLPTDYNVSLKQDISDTNTVDATRYWVTQNYLGSFTETDPIYSADPASSITNTNITNWQTAYGWGNHGDVDYQNDSDTTSWDATRYWVGQQGYLTSISETDPIYSADPASSITNTNITNWQTAYGWGNHGDVDYQNDSDTTSWDATRYWVGQQGYLTSISETDPIYSADPASSITNTNITNWQTAYGWGNHGDVDYQNDSDTTSWDATRYWVGQQGYLTSISETDPIYSGDPASSITSAQINFWNTAYGWGNHGAVGYQNDSDTTLWDATRYWVGQQGYLTSISETDPIYSGDPASSITSAQINFWNTAYGWGNHANVGYLKWSDTSNKLATDYDVSLTRFDSVFVDYTNTGFVDGWVKNLGTIKVDTSISGGGTADSDWTISGNNMYSGVSGNVGIGIQTPGEKLDVTGIIKATGGSSTNWNTAYGWGDHSTAGYVENEIDPQVGANTSQYIPVWSGIDLIAGTIFDNGNVGIGNASPGYKLDVTGHAHFTDSVRVEGSFFLPSTGSTGQVTALIIDPTTKRVWYNDLSNDYLGYISLTGGYYPWYNGSVLTNGEISQANNNVGISDITPTYKLDVNGTFHAVGNSQIDGILGVTGTLTTEKVQAIDSDGLSLFEDGGAGIFVKNGGNVGIGTTNPAATLHIAHTYYSSSIFQRSTDIIAGGVIIQQKSRGTVASPTAVQEGDILGVFFFKGYDGSAWRPASNIAAHVTHIDADTIGGSLTFATRDTNNVKATRLFIDHFGNVGVGTTNPEATLDIAGSVNFNETNVTTGTTYSVADNDCAIHFTGTSNIIMTLPDESRCPGRWYLFCNDGSAIITIKDNDGSTVIKTVTAGNSGSVISLGSKWWAWY